MPVPAAPAIHSCTDQPGRHRQTGRPVPIAPDPGNGKPGRIAVAAGGVPPFRRSRPGLLVCVLWLLCACRSAVAQKPPQLGYVFPPAVCAGRATDVQLGGSDFTPDMQWFVHDAGVQLRTSGVPGDYHLTPPPYWIGPRASTTALPIPREVPGRLHVDAQTPAGLVRWQVANANGASATAVFYVSRGSEITESRSRDFPQRLPTLPVAVSGRLSRLTEVDRYELVAERDGLVSVDLMARRLGSGLHGALRVLNAAGELLADFADTQGLDGGVTFAARAGATYTIELHDVDFRGHRSFVYRLAITAGPRVICTLPARGRRGTTREVEFIGLGLASGEARLESLRQLVEFPADSTRATHTQRLETPFGTAEVVIPLSDVTELAEAPGEQAGLAKPLELPVGITRRLPPEIDEQPYTWQAEPGEHFAIDLESRAVGGRLDVALAVLDPQGKPLGESDDLPGTTDAGLEIRAAAGGTYTCLVSARSSRRGTADELYRLQIRRRKPGYSLTVPQQVNLPLGGSADLTVKAARSGGFDGEIALAAEGLPQGVTAEGPWTIPAGKNEAKVTLQASHDAAVVARVIRFVGTAQRGASQVRETAAAAAAGNLCPRSPAAQQIAPVLLAITMAPPFEVRIVDRERQRDVHRGTTYRAEVEIVRQEGFSGEVQLEMTAQQSRDRQGIRGPIVAVPPQATRALYPCFMPEWLGTELTRRMIIQGVAAVPDPQGKLRYVTRPGDARITMILEGALLKLVAEAGQARLHAGESFQVPIRLSRSAKLPLPATVELVVPDEIAGLVHAEPLVLAPADDRGTLRIDSVADPRLAGPWLLKLTATALQDGRWPVVSECDLPVTFQDR